MCAIYLRFGSLETAVADFFFLDENSKTEMDWIQAALSDRGSVNAPRRKEGDSTFKLVAA